MEFISDMTNEEYHQATDWISKSGLDQIDKSPFHYHSKYLQKTEKKQTEPMRVGTAFHTFMLEPDRFHGNFHIVPDCRKGSAVWKEHEAAADGKEMIKQSETEMLSNMKDSIFSHPKAGKILAHTGLVERSFFGEIEGVQVKCRPDWVQPDYGVAIDLKSSASATKKEFMWYAKRFRYWVQHPFYLDVMASCGLDTKEFYFIVVEKEPPYPVAVYYITPWDVDSGRTKYLENLKTYQECLETGNWYGYNRDQITEIHMPGNLLE